MNDNQKFCVACGREALGGVVKSQADKRITRAQVDEIDHDVLVFYLENIRSMEYTKSEIEAERAAIANRATQFGRRDYIPRFECYYAPPLKVFLVLFGLMIIAMVAGGGVEGAVGFGILSLPFLAIILVRLLKDYVRYSRANREQNDRLDREEKERQKGEARDKVLEKELNSVQKLLDDAYSINWIPVICRNVYGAYFLHSYISTSTATLKEAALQFSLDKISQKLDAILEMERMAVIQRARANALNEIIVAQNNELIASAIRQEESMQRIEEYQKINNTYQAFNLFYQGMTIDAINRK